jgi:nitroimidazol reductase NimA-like FMN-containing flavoprotein (pyridoxamine 5'-phosphate oxidase superfamily)
VTGTYLELNVPQYHTAQREHARERLAAQCSEWWRIPLSEARDRSLISSMETVFFRIDIKAISGLRAIPEAEESAHQETGH